MITKVLLTLRLCLALIAGAVAQTTDSTKKLKATLDMHPFAGLSLINSNWSPAFGYSFAVQLSEQNGRARYKIAADYTLNTIGSLDKAHFKELNTVTSYDLRLMANTTSPGAKTAWLGISAGYMRSNAGGDLDKRIKVGVTAQRQQIAIMADFFKSSNKEQNLALTLKYFF